MVVLVAIRALKLPLLDQNLGRRVCQVSCTVVVVEGRVGHGAQGEEDDEGDEEDEGIAISVEG